MGRSRDIGGRDAMDNGQLTMDNGGDRMSKRAELEGVHRLYRVNCGE